MDKNTQDIVNASMKAGQDILDSVSKAINSNDYSKLAGDITNAVKTVTVPRKTTYASGKQVQQTAPQYNRQPYTPNQYQNNGVYAAKATTQNMKTPFFAKKISRYDGLAGLIIWAILGVFVAVPTAIGTLLTGSVPAMIVGLSFLAICAIFSVGGIKKLKLASKFYQYGNAVKSREYFDISDLAKAVLKTDKEVLKDIKEMIKKGYLPRARLDSTEKTCMITDAAYELYLGAEKDRLDREKKELDQKKASLKAGSKAQNPDKKELTGVEAIIADGNEYIEFVRATNDIIPDTELMSSKLYRLEDIMNKIFDQVKKNPQSADDLHRLMNYYLPTTKKLLDAYVELDRQGGGANAVQTKSEISEAMDTINEAFENLLDSMFQDMAWDISSDISVMKTMMAQDGLTENGGMAMQTMPKQD